MSSPVTDEQLIARVVVQDDRHAFGELVRRHQSTVRATLRRLTAGNHALADDLAQETFIRAARSLHGFRGDARFSTWLNRIAINTSLTFLRSRRRKPDFAGEEELAGQPAPHASPSRAAAHGELDTAIESSLARLAPELRAAITLTAIHGLKPAEAAASLGCLTATLYWRVHQARKLLRADLKEHLS